MQLAQHGAGCGGGGGDSLSCMCAVCVVLCVSTCGGINYGGTLCMCGMKDSFGAGVCACMHVCTCVHMFVHGKKRAEKA